MSDQYVGEIRMFSGNFAPQGWHAHTVSDTFRPNAALTKGKRSVH